MNMKNYLEGSTEMDLIKLGGLIEVCAEAGVRELKIEGIEVSFGNGKPLSQVSVAEVLSEPGFTKMIGTDPRENPETPSLDQVVQDGVDGKADEIDFDKEMLHLTDPTAWANEVMKGDSDE